MVIEGRVEHASDDPAEVVPGAGIVAIAAPFAAHREILSRISPWVDAEAWVGGFPGFGGFDWRARFHLGRSPVLFGLQRIPYVCHKLDYGHRVAITGIRPQLFIAALPAGRVNEITATLRELLSIRAVPTGNYLNVTCSNSNPIMNPARLYALFRNWAPGRIYDSCPCFFGDWDESSTAIYLRCDDELHALCRAIPLDLAYVKPLVQHFEVATRQDITDKIRGLTSLQHRLAPMRQLAEDQWELDLGHSYFTEDIPYGIVVLRGVAELVGVATPMLDEIILWAQEQMGVRYLADGRISGGDTAGLPIPQNFGVTTLDELVRRALV